MNTYSSAQQPSRQMPRLQNTSKTSLGNGLGGTGWGGNGFGLGGGLGGGFGASARPPALSGFAQVMGGGSGQGPIDMSDFPSLSGGQRAAPSSAAFGSWNSNVVRQPSQSQQLPQNAQAQPQQPNQAQQQQRAPSAAPSQQSLDQYDGQRSQQASTDRGGNGDDFSPLGGQLNGGAMGGHSNGFNSTIASPDVALQNRNGQMQAPQQLPIRSNDAAIGFPQQTSQAPIDSSQTAASSHAPPITQNGQPPPGGMKKYADMTEQEKCGLTGLLAGLEARRQIEAGQAPDETLPPAMRNGVFMGQDLGSLGMELESPEALYPTFSVFSGSGSGRSTFDFHERHVLPDFTLPSAYTVSNVPPLQSRMGAFSDETLFSIFYQHPRSIEQELASIELTARDWRWHKVLRQWLQKDTRESSSSSSLPIVDLAQNHTIGAMPVRVSERAERGVYVFFDAMNWRRERREFVLDYSELDHRNVGGSAGQAPQPTNGVGIGPAPGLGVGGPVQPPTGIGNAPAIGAGVGNAAS